MRTTALQTDAQGHLSGRSLVLGLRQNTRVAAWAATSAVTQGPELRRALQIVSRSSVSILKYEQGAPHYHFALGPQIMWLVLGAGPSRVLCQLGFLGEVTFSL